MKLNYNGIIDMKEEWDNMKVTLDGLSLNVYCLDRQFDNFEENLFESLENVTEGNKGGYDDGEQPLWDLNNAEALKDTNINVSKPSTY